MLLPDAFRATTPARYTVLPWITTWLMRGPASLRSMLIVSLPYNVMPGLGPGIVQLRDLTEEDGSPGQVRLRRCGYARKRASNSSSGSGPRPGPSGIVATPF